MNVVQVVSFVVTNPVTPLSPPPLYISASRATPGADEAFEQTIAPTLVASNASLLLDLMGAQAGDAQPLQVEIPAFKIHDIHQSSDYPGASNTITVSVSSNYGMFALKTGGGDNDRHSLHIGNLTGASTLSTQNIEMILFNMGSASKDLWHEAFWDQDTGEITIFFKQDKRFREGILYVLAFTLTNGKRQAARVATIELRIGQGQVALPPTPMRTIDSCYNLDAWRDSQDRTCQHYAANPNWCDGLFASDLPVQPPSTFKKSVSGLTATDSYFGELLDATHACCVCRQSGRGILEIAAPAFVQSGQSAAQSSCYPDVDNLITITLKINLHIAARTQITISGLVGSSIQSTTFLPLLGPPTPMQSYSSLPGAHETCSVTFPEEKCLAQGCCRFDANGPQGNSVDSRCYASVSSGTGCSAFGSMADWQQHGMLTLNLTRSIAPGQVNVVRILLSNPSHNNTARPLTINVTRWQFYGVTAAEAAKYQAGLASSNASWLLCPENCVNISQCNASAPTYANCSVLACPSNCTLSDPRPPAPKPPQALWNKEIIVQDSILQAVTVDVHDVVAGSDAASSAAASIACNTHPMHVEAPSVAVGIRQTSAYPGATNRLIFSIISNVKLTHAGEDGLIVHGLSEAQHAEGLIQLFPYPNTSLDYQLFAPRSDPISVGKGIWKEGVEFRQVSAPSLTLAIQELSDWNKGTLYSFAVHITNPTFAQASPSIYIVHQGTRYNIQPTLAHKASGVLLNAQGIIVGEEQPMSIAAKH